MTKIKIIDKFLELLISIRNFLFKKKPVIRLTDD